MKKVFISILWKLMFLVSVTSYSVTAVGLVWITNTWPPSSEFDKLSFFQQINNDGGENSHYYWANQFSFKGNGGGYMGLQTRGVGSGGVGIRGINYSIWTATGWEGSNCGSFDGGEGKGVQCQTEMSWKTGHTYQLDVSKNGNIVTGTVTDLMDGTSIEIGKIIVPANFGKLIGSSGFVEEYGGQVRGSCYALGAQSSVFRNPLGDSTIVAKQSTDQSNNAHGICGDAYVVHAACNDTECLNTVSNLGWIASPDVPQVPITNGQTITQKEIAQLLDSQGLVAIRLFDGKLAPDIYFPDAVNYDWKSIFIDHRAGQTTLLHFNNKEQRVEKGQQIMFMSKGGLWEVVK
ncbi:DUF3472 domain-containing protein [Xenorhabdus entomophaga]|uniref:DUF3472 domain-containing protein n=1 Tax=Xenorhabdus entomophaga TaxID=3136257 RepID=UPI0030F47A22